MSLPIWRAAILFAAIVTFGSSSFAEDTPPPDTLIYHAVIVPSHERSPDAVAIHGSRITAIGNSADLLATCPPNCEKVDAGGQFLLPGFHDSHAHLSSGGKASFEIRLDRQDIPSIQSAVRDYAKANPEKEWLTGGTWRAAAFDPSHPPHRADLDAAEAQRPVVLRDTSGHELWANSAALKLAGITRDTADPPGGRIARDAQGAPTGVLYESATTPIYTHMPPPTLADLREQILKGQEIALACGVTSAEGNAVPLTVRAATVYAELAGEGRLVQRSFLWGNLAASEADFAATVRFAQSLPRDGRVQIVAFKGFVDGVLTSETAAMFEPYANKPGDRGLARGTQKGLNKLVLRANRAGYPAALHAIGDRAVHMALDAFENAQTTLGPGIHNRVEHASLIAPDDVPRFAKLGVIASVQPAFMFLPSQKDLAYITTCLGPGRLGELYRWKSLRDAGATLISGSDFPSSGRIGPDPIAGLHCLIHRTFGDGTPFRPEECLDPDTAIATYTSVPAEAVGFGKTLGRIEIGYEADLILLAQDPRLAVAFGARRNPPQKIWIAGKRIK